MAPPLKIGIAPLMYYMQIAQLTFAYYSFVYKKLRENYSGQRLLYISSINYVAIFIQLAYKTLFLCKFAYI